MSSPKIRSGLINVLIYEQAYSFLTTYNYGEVPENMGNGQIKVAG